MVGTKDEGGGGPGGRGGRTGLGKRVDILPWDNGSDIEEGATEGTDDVATRIRGGPLGGGGCMSKFWKLLIVLFGTSPLFIIAANKLVVLGWLPISTAGLFELFVPESSF